jgi:hypothetical protein
VGWSLLSQSMVVLLNSYAYMTPIFALDVALVMSH